MKHFIGIVVALWVLLFQPAARAQDVYPLETYTVHVVMIDERGASRTVEATIYVASTSRKKQDAPTRAETQRAINNGSFRVYFSWAAYKDDSAGRAGLVQQLTYQLPLALYPANILFNGVGEVTDVH